MKRARIEWRYLVRCTDIATACHGPSRKICRMGIKTFREYGALQNCLVCRIDNAIATGQGIAQHVDGGRCSPVHEIAAEHITAAFMRNGIGVF